MSCPPCSSSGFLLSHSPFSSALCLLQLSPLSLTEPQCAFCLSVDTVYNVDICAEGVYINNLMQEHIHIFIENVLFSNI